MSTTIPVRPEQSRRALSAHPEHSQRESPVRPELVEGHSLCERLPLLASAPGGIKKLRELILELAVRGKLMPQDPSDEPVSNLLQQILVEKTNLLDENKIRKTKRPLEVGQTEGLFELPSMWRWVRLADVCAVITDGDHLPPPKVNDGIPFLVIGDVRDGNIDLERASRRVPQEYFQSLDWTRRPQTGDVLLTTVGSFGIPIAVSANEEFCFQRHIALLRPALRPLQLWLFNALRSGCLFQQLSAAATGIAQKTVSLASLRSSMLPLPPIAEQHRIVAKVDELMALCDRLEAQQADAEAAHATLIKTLLDTLTQSQSAEDFAANWQRLSAHFDTLFTTESSIDALKQTVLQLTVMGEFADGQETNIRIGKLSDFVSFLNGYAFKSEWFSSSGIRLLRNANLSIGHCNWQDTVFLPESHGIEFDRFRLDSGDLVISLDRPIIAGGLKIARLQDQDIPCLLLQRVAMIAPHDGRVDPQFLYHWMNSPAFINAINPGRSNGVPHISTKQIGEVEFRCLPLADQKSIVVKLEELLNVCERLKEQLFAFWKLQKRLADTLLAQMIDA